MGFRSRYLEETLSDNAINKALEHLGITKTDGKDEFDTVNLRRHRFIDDWINKESFIDPLKGLCHPN